VCQSVHHVMKAEKLLKGVGIPLKIINTPRWISSGCGVVIRVRTVDAGRAETICTDEGIALEGVYPYAAPGPGATQEPHRGEPIRDLPG